MRRGDIVTVAVSGDDGKPRPALIVQSDALSSTDGVLVCLLTTTLIAASFHRLAIPATADTGLREPSQVMVDKIMSVRRDRCGAKIGAVDQAILQMLGQLLAFMVGIADP